VLRRALEQVRGRTSASTWQAFWQVAVEGRKPADVARDLGLSANAVYIATSRMLCRLRAELGEFDRG
jgi:RNA polymerase sigma-70 factor (ECF subfamily)